jgi:hypothetical protein
MDRFPALASALGALSLHPLRTRVVAGVIAAAAAVGVLGVVDPDDALEGAPFAACVVAWCVLRVAVGADLPEVLAGERARRISGAGPRSVRRPRKVAGVLLGFGASAVGICAGTVGAIIGGVDLTGTADTGATTPLDEIAWLGAVMGAGLVVAATIDPPERRAARNQRFARAARLGLAPLCLVVALGSSSMIQTDWDAGLLIPVVAVFALVSVALVHHEIIEPLVARLTAMIPAGLEGIAALGARYRISGPARLTMLGCGIVVTTGAVLGASAEDRATRWEGASDALATSAFVPPNVMATSFNPMVGLGVTTFEFPPSLGEAIERELPHAEVIPVEHIVLRDDLALLLCWHDACDLPAAVADPRLERVYGRPAHEGPAAMLQADGASTAAYSTSIAAPTAEELVGGYIRDRSRPAVSWEGLNFRLFPRDAVGSATTKVATLFVVADRAFTAAERDWFTAEVARTSGLLTSVTADSISEGFDVDLPGTPPYSAVDDAVRSQLLLTAAVVALIVLASTVSIESLDRRRELLLLHRLGADRAQAASAAAVATGLHTIVALLVGGAIALWIITFGVDAFNEAVPMYALDVRVPAGLLLAGLVAVPLLSAAVAAAGTTLAMRAVED